MRRSTILALLTSGATLGLVGSASAATSLRPDCPGKLLRSATHHRAIVVKLHGRRAPGRDIVRYGRVAANQRTVPATCHQIRTYRRQLVQLHAAPSSPLLVRTAVDPAQRPAGVQTSSVAAGGTLSAIAACESGGNPSAVGGGGAYRGKYQFDYETWASVGGSGDPAAASEAEQDRRAAVLYAQRGSSPWPVCGR